MPGRLLILSFHNAPRTGARAPLLVEDLLFKQHAIASGLIDRDAMDMAAPPDSALLEDAKVGPYSGLERGVLGPTSLIDFNRVGANAWARDAFQRRKNPADPARPLPSLLEAWLNGVFAHPVDVLVLAGHHQAGVVWGAEDARASWHRWYSALVPRVATDEQGRRLSILEIQGYRRVVKPGEPDERQLRAGPFDLTGTLARCRLLVILGCNGATEHAVRWRNWVTSAAGRSPFILGWYGVHGFSTVQAAERLSPPLWRNLRTLAPSNNLDFLHDPAFAGRVVREAWVAAVREAFGNSRTRSHLLFGRRRGGPRGAGAIDPSGTIWEVVDRQGTVEPKRQIPEEEP